MVTMLTPQQLARRWRDRAAARDMRAAVAQIIDTVRRNGDKALVRYAKQFDGATLRQLRVPAADLRRAWQAADPALRRTLRTVAARIRKFAQAQRDSVQETALRYDGMTLTQRLRPVGRVGVYVPGGKHPLPSTALMTIIPAQIAGVKEIVVCSPPSHKGRIHPCILAACFMLGVREVWQVGGAQAVAAMAYGTRSIRRVDKIAGPGNAWVNTAKLLVVDEVGIDMFAGPTDLVVIADNSIDDDTLARDLYGQAEHGPDSKAAAIVFSPARARSLAAACLRHKSLLQFAPNIFICAVKHRAAAAALADELAPEHLQLCVTQPRQLAGQINNAGSLFVGAMTPSVLGDYSLGPNHTLPTEGAARFRGGLSVFDFLKIQTTQSVNAQGYAKAAKPGIALAAVEGLPAHAAALASRLKRR